MYNYNFFDDKQYRGMMNNSYRNMNGNTNINTIPNVGINNMNGMNNSMTNMNNMLSLYTPEEGYNNGIMFSNLYSQYKNYKPAVLSANNEKERLLLDLSRFAFAAHELNLYLDLNPDDNSMLALFNDYREKANELERQYEAKYGPLSISGDGLSQTPFAWENTAWPWEENYYV